MVTRSCCGATAIVQLGYTREAEPIVFIAQRPDGDDNTLFFSDQGVRIHREQLKWLEPLSWYEDDSGSGP